MKKKKIEKLTVLNLNYIRKYEDQSNLVGFQHTQDITEIVNKINEIIEVLNSQDIHEE